MRFTPLIKVKSDVIIVGGGLAGLTSAIHLAKSGINILLIEKNKYPTHKVCGEYISNEVLPYFKFLGIDPFQLGAKRIKNFELSLPNSKSINCQLPLGGFGISRYAIDAALAEKAKSNDVEIIQDKVTDIQFLDDEFIVLTKNNTTYKSKIVIGAYGKRSEVDVRLKRRFINKKSPFLAVKTHVLGDFPDDLVGLHNFKGGYCGTSKVEDDAINLCYITDYKAFKKYKNIDEFQRKVIFKNKKLKSIFTHSKSVFKSPLSISQISFSPKKPVEKHILMCGDTAGLIHPLCGNGMSMAIRSGQMVSQLILNYLNSEIGSRAILEREYQKAWKKAFNKRLRVGRFIASILNKDRVAEVMMVILQLFPGILPIIIKYTHGKPMRTP